MVGSSSQQRQLITYHVEFTEEEHPQPAPSPEHSLAYRRPTGGGRQVGGMGTGKLALNSPLCRYRVCVGGGLGCLRFVKSP